MAHCGVLSVRITNWINFPFRTSYNNTWRSTSK